MCCEMYTLVGSGDEDSIFGAGQQGLEVRKSSWCMMLEEVQETKRIRDTLETRS